MNNEKNPPVKAAFFLGMFCGKSLKPTILLFYSLFAMTFWWYLPPKFLPSDAPNRAAIFGEQAMNAAALEAEIGSARLEVRLFAALILFGGIPALIVKFLFREKLSDYSVRLGNHFTVRSLLIFTPVMILLAWLAAFNDGFRLIYPYNPDALSGHGAFGFHSVLCALCFYPAWEFFFRGFLQHGLEDSCGLFNAVLIQSLAAAMLHFGHPMTETLGAFGGSIFWGFLVLRTRSLLAGTVQHAALGIALNWFLVRYLF